MGPEREIISCDLLRWARERAGLTPAAAAQVAHRLAGRGAYRAFSSQEVEDWEAGRTMPTVAALETLAEVYSCPVGYFFLPAPPEEPHSLSYRGLDPDNAERLSYPSRRSLQRFRWLVGWFASLLASLPGTWPVTLRPAAPGTSEDEVAAQERARLGFEPKVRASWGSSEEAFVWWRRRIEELGVFVFELPLLPQEVRGASIWMQDGPPAILVNHQDMEWWTGRLFTLVHEYAHLVIAEAGLVCDLRGQPDSHSVEHKANRIAAKMLVSDDDLRAALAEVGVVGPREKWSDSILDALKTRLHVSRDVVAVLLESNQLAPPGFYRFKRRAWDARRQRFGGRTSRPRTKVDRVLSTLGFTAAKLLTSPVVAEKASALDLSEVLETRAERVYPLLEQLRGLVAR